MTQMLVHKCRYCGGVIKVRMEGQEIIDVEGGKRVLIYARHREKLSNKLIRCTSTRSNRSKPLCFRVYRLTSFTEMVL